MNIRPVSDLRNKFTEIETAVKNGEPVYLTKNGYGSMVVISLDEYERLNNMIEIKLDEADAEAELTDERLTSEQVFDSVRKAINAE